MYLDWDIPPIEGIVVRGRMVELQLKVGKDILLQLPLNNTLESLHKVFISIEGCTEPFKTQSKNKLKPQKLKTRNL